MSVTKTFETVAASEFIAADEYEEFTQYNAQRRSFATTELSAKEVKAIAKARMHPRHRKLNALIDPGSNHHQ